nr:hypothetical protein CFP56_58154 [Quercus suber]
MTDQAVGQSRSDSMVDIAITSMAVLACLPRNTCSQDEGIHEDPASAVRSASTWKRTEAAIQIGAQQAPTGPDDRWDAVLLRHRPHSIVRLSSAVKLWAYPPLDGRPTCRGVAAAPEDRYRTIRHRVVRERCLGSAKGPGSLALGLQHRRGTVSSTTGRSNMGSCNGRARLAGIISMLQV